MKSKKFCFGVILSCLLVLGASSCGEKTNDPPIVPPNNDKETVDETPTETSPHNHTYGDWVITTPATCTETGIRTKTCSCGDTVTETLDATGHTMVADKAIAPTCTELGMTEGRHCSICNMVELKQEPIPMISHEYHSAFTAPTSTEDGYTEYTCSVCNHTYTETLVPKAFHVTSANIEVIGYTGESNEKLVIPGVFQMDNKWYRVVSISQYAFRDCDNLVSVIIPDSVTDIGNRAFNGCHQLQTITLPNSVTSIGQHVFDDCFNLSSVVIPNNLTIIPYGAFRNCNSLAEITIPSSVTEIHNYAFAGCTGLSNVTIPDTVTELYPSSFEGCTALTSITLPKGLTRIKSAFQGCTGLTSITIPDGVTEICHSAFLGCSGLTSITIPDSVTSIDHYAFANCSNLTSIALPAGIQAIKSYMFKGCSNLTTVTIPDSVTIIERGAFEDCTQLTSIYIPDTVATIEESAFSNCTTLSSIVLPDHLTTICRGTFSGCKNLVFIDIPDSLATIEYAAFSGCQNLVSITIPKHVTSIANYAFSGCEKLIEIIDQSPSLNIIAGSNDFGEIAKYAVAVYDSTESKIVNTEAGYLFFPYDKTYLIGYIGNDTNLDLPNEYDDYIIYKYAFRDNKSITSVTITDNVTEIDSSAFKNCTSLTDIYYTGTEEQWNTLTKESRWDDNYTLYCNYIPE